MDDLSIETRRIRINRYLVIVRRLPWKTDKLAWKRYNRNDCAYNINLQKHIKRGIEGLLQFIGNGITDHSDPWRCAHSHLM